MSTKNPIAAILIAMTLLSHILAADPTAWVINTSGETLSKINLATGIVENNILTLGSDIFSFPNQVMVRDTLAYVVNSGTDEIQIINLNTETTAGWINFPDFSNPYYLDFSSNGYAYVTLLTDNSLAKVDLASNQVISIIPIGQSPQGLIILDDIAYVACTGYNFSTFSFDPGSLTAYDCLGDTIITSIPTSANPQFVEFDRGGNIQIICSGASWTVPPTPSLIQILDTQTLTIIDSLDTDGNPAQVAVSPDNNIFLAAGGFVDDGEVYMYNADTYSILFDSANPIVTDSGAFGVVTFQDSTAFIGTFGDRIFQVNASGATINTFDLGDGPIDLDFNYIPGDANGDFVVNIGDAVLLVNYIFKGGDSPRWPSWRANANGDGNLNIGDAVYLVNFVFSGGPRPLLGPTWKRW